MGANWQGGQMPQEFALDEQGRWEVAVFARAQRTHFVDVVDGLGETVVSCAGAGEDVTLGRAVILHEGMRANPYRLTVRSQLEDGSWLESQYRASFDHAANRHVIETDDNHADSSAEGHNDCTVHVWKMPATIS
jgi:hypothetical protein